MKKYCKGTVFEESQELLDNLRFEDALLYLNTTKPTLSIIGHWQLGLIYHGLAHQLSESFAYRYYANSLMKNKYGELLESSHYHLFEVASNIPYASQDLQDELKNVLWRKLHLVETEILILNNSVSIQDDLDDIASSPTDDDKKFENEIRTDSLIMELSEWNL